MKSIKDLFQIDRAMLDRYGSDLEALRDFPEKLREAVSLAMPDALLGSLGIPKLGPNRAKTILTKLAVQHSCDEWTVLVKTLDELWDETISESIQRWLRCDPRSVDVFQSEIVELQKYMRRDSVRRFRPQAKIGIAGFEMPYDWLSLFSKKQMNYVKDWNWTYHVGQIDAVVVPYEGFKNSMAEYASKSNLPIFTREEFYAAFLKE